MKVLPKFRGSSRRTKLLNPFRLSFSNRLFIFCSILSVIFPTLASISQWITTRDDEHVCQLSECVWKPSHLSYSTFNLATGRADYTSKLSLLKCNIRSIIYEPRVYKVRKTKKVEGVPNGRLLGLVHVILSYALIPILLFGTVLILLVTVCTNGDIFDLKENPVLVILTIVVLMSLESSCVTGAMSYWHSSQGAAGSKYHGVGYQVTNWNKLTSIIVGGLSCRPYAWTRKLVGMLLLLSGDVECNPGPPPPVDETCPSDTDRNPGPPPPVDETCPSDADRKESRPSKLPKAQTCPNFHGLTDVPTSHMDELIKRKERKIPYVRPSSYPMCNEQVIESVVKQNSIEPPGNTVFQEDDKYKESLEENVNKFIGELKKTEKWSEQHGFLEIDGDKIESLLPSEGEMGHFYLLTNQLYRARGKCAVCLLCGRNKEAVSHENPPKVIDSHIFPECLLNVYRDIHCDEEPECIYDPSTKKAMGPGKLTIKLFCDRCEKSASCKEELLRNYYIDLVCCNDKPVTLDKADWLIEISATLMFRGMLTGINVLKEIRHDRWTLLMGTMSSLRNYILGIGPLPQALALYLLPNGPFNPNNTDPLFIYDYVLRCPRFTSVVQCENKTFLYTKFDCFHWVLPLDNQRNRGLKETTNCFYMFPENGSIKLYSSDERKLIFPRLLLKVCALQSVEMEMTFLENKCMKRYHGMCIQRFPCSNLRYTVPLNLHWTIKKLEEGDTEMKIKNAQNLSPLKDASYSKEIYKKERKALEERINRRDKQIDNYKKHGQDKHATENEELKNMNKILTEANETLIEENRCLKLESCPKFANSITGMTPDIELSETNQSPVQTSGESKPVLPSPPTPSNDVLRPVL